MWQGYFFWRNMYYIIFDLEWNNSYNYKTKSGINEIIEIGALKLNQKLEIVDSFKQLIKPKLSKKLGSRFKNLTHITMDEIKANGVDFDTAFKDFALWSREEGNIFMSWSNSDLYTLVYNFLEFHGKPDVDFIKKYADAQKYCMQTMNIDNTGNQISLASCAKELDINIEEDKLHRALTDCYITAYCFKKLYNAEKFKTFVNCCDESFFKRLVYKPYFIKPDSNEFDVNSISLECPECKNDVKLIKPYEFSNNSYRSVGECSKCHKKLWVTVRAKRTYDDIIITKRLIAINKKRAKHIN